MRNVETIEFQDLDSGDGALIIIRCDRDKVALTISLEHDGDVQVVFEKALVARIVKALQSAAVDGAA